MKYVAAYLLANLGGNASPTAKDIEKILGAGGLDVDMEDAKKVVDSLAGKTVEEVIKEGQKKLATVPSGGGGGAAPAAAAAAPAAAGKPAAEAKKKEEKKEESEEDEDMGFGLFD